MLRYIYICIHTHLYIYIYILHIHMLHICSYIYIFIFTYIQLWVWYICFSWRPPTDTRQETWMMLRSNGGRTSNKNRRRPREKWDQDYCRWWQLKDFLCSCLPGEMIQFHSYFSNGLKPPTRGIPWIFCYMGMQYILPSYIGIVTSHHKDSYELISIIGMTWEIWTLAQVFWGISRCLIVWSFKDDRSVVEKNYIGIESMLVS